MANEVAAGVGLIKEVVGEGPIAKKGDAVTYNAQLFLRRGDEVAWDAGILGRAREHVKTRTIDGVELIDHVTILGKRQVMAGIEKALYGMCAGGYREIVVAPHLGYGDAGLPGVIPPRALLRVLLWVQAVENNN